MNKEIFVKKMQVSGILFKYNVPINEAKIIGTFIEELEQQVKKQQEVIDEARQCIKDFLCSEEYINIDGDAIANNYENILGILNEVSE